MKIPIYKMMSDAYLIKRMEKGKTQYVYTISIIIHK